MRRERKSKRLDRGFSGAVGLAVFTGLLTIVGLSGVHTASAQRPQINTPRIACDRERNPVIAHIYAEYGAVFRAAAKVPAKCIFESDADVLKFQSKLDVKTAEIGGAEIQLQAPAMDALLAAVDEAESQGLRITPLDGSVAGKRSFADTVRIWNSRFEPALRFWVRQGKIGRDEAEAASKMAVLDQLEQVLDWEGRGYYFSTGRNRPIMSSVAPPGTSQHLSMLAFDIEQAGNPAVSGILNRNGWFQTVVNDTPHFTYLGFTEAELPKQGLKQVIRGGHKYWVPDL